MNDSELPRIRRLVCQESSAQGGSSPLPALLRRLCSVAARDLPVTWCGVSLMTEADPLGMGAASDATCEALEELQFTVGEGPCIDAFWSRRPVFADDLRAGAPLRWPFYTPCALDFGARAVFALPLQVGAARLGVLGLYSDRPGGLPDHALTRALAFADVATEAVLDGESLVDEGLAADALDETIGHSWDVYQAQGMVMAQLGTDIVDAMVRLRAHAHTNHCRLDDVAGDIVTGRLTLAALTQA